MFLKKLTNIKAYPRYTGKALFFCRELIVGLIDAVRIRRVLCLQSFRKLADECARQLKPYYENYVTEVSVSDHAISFELSVFLLAVCKIRKPAKILDLGSGFSSFVFRFYAKNCTNKVSVYSVDDSSQWLNKTNEFLIKCVVSSQNVLDWQSFFAHNQERFDLILNDFSNVENRIARFGDVLAMIAPDGLAVLDDMHKPEYAKYVLVSLKKYNFKHYSLKAFTKDKFGRYSTLILNQNTK